MKAIGRGVPILRAWPAVWLLALLMPAGAAMAGEVERSGLLGEGTPQETSWFLRDTGIEGPTVMIVGGIHGNEPAGAVAAEQIRHWPLLRGRLLVVPRANPLALEANQRSTPGAARGHGNLNRNFPRAADDEPRCDRSRELWELIEEHRPDWLIDLHEGFAFHVSNSNSVGSSVIWTGDEEIEPLVKRMLEVVNATVEDEEKRFVPLRRGSASAGLMAWSAAEFRGANAMIVETTFRDQPLALRARQQRLMVHRLLADIGVVEDDAAVVNVLTPRGREASADGERLYVAVYQGGGSAGGPAVQRIAREMGALVHTVGPEDVRGGALRQFDVAVFPGGSGSRQANAVGARGREQVREFIDAGGGYVGICAGAYLGTYRYTWGLKIIDAYTVDRENWRRGRAPVEIELTDAGREILGEGDRLTVRYANGPLLGRAEVDYLPEFEVLAWFREEVADHGAPTGVMIDTPAIIAAPFGAGRVMLISPHPEATRAHQWLIENALLWAAQREQGR